MKLKITIAISYLFLVSSVAGAVCIKGNPSIADEYSNSQYVFIGKVILQKDVPESKNYYEGNEYTVEVLDIFKGNPTSPVVIFSENSSGRFPMSVGGKYILFVYYELGRYQVSNCGNSGFVSEKKHVIQAIKDIRKKRFGVRP
jgi:hypothetical protein